MMGIISWLIILVVAGLIVNFIVNPSSFYSFKENVNDVLNSFSASDDVIKVSSMQPCLEREFNRIICKGVCYSNGLNYKTFECVKGEVICSCKNDNTN